MSQISITTDYCTSLGDPSIPLKLIAEAGFTHLHWCHHFNDDFVYGPYEIAAIRNSLKQLGLHLLDVHGSYGQEKRWWSLNETERKAGEELVLNRAHLFKELGGEGHLIMHIPLHATNFTDIQNEEQDRQFQQAIRSLDSLVPQLEKMGVDLALENMPNDTWELLEKAVARYPEKVVGFCYDSGHGNINGDAQSQLTFLERNKARLSALHLNDNNGTLDQHQPPYMGTVDWERLANIIATSSYKGPLSFEITMRATPFLTSKAPVLIPPQIQTFTGLSAQPLDNQKAFLKDAHERCLKLHDRIAQLREL